MLSYNTLKVAHDYMNQLEPIHMSILHYSMNEGADSQHLKGDDRFNRNPLEDLKNGLDLVFELKSKLDALHPIATETLIRLLSH